VAGLPFEHADGTSIKVDTDFSGRKRNVLNPSPGPFEITGSGLQKIKLW
jgi:alpha-N-arabinofuranosidase